MERNMDNKISFNGTFLLKRPTKTVKNEIAELCGNKRKMIFDFNPDMLCVVRDSKDKAIADYIMKKDLSFKYYQELNTTSGFDIAHPDKAKAILEGHTPISSTKELRIKFPKPVEKEKKFSFIDRSMKALHLNPETHTTRSIRGTIHVYDKNQNLKARISPPGKFGINYAYVQPKTTDDAPLRFALDKNGKIIFEYTTLSGAKQFQKNFSDALRHSKGMD